MDPVEAATARVAGADLAYDVWGPGAPVVFVHGTGTHRRTFEPVIRALPHDRAYVAYDRRGFGDSSGPLAGSISSHVEDLAALLDHLDMGPASIVSQSGGAVIALDFAVRHPTMTRDLVLAEPAIHMLATPSLSAVIALALVHIRRVILRRPEEALLGFYRWASRRRGAANGYDGLPEEWRAVAATHGPAVFRELGHLLTVKPPARALKAIGVPVTLVIGDIGQPVFHRTTRRAAKLLSHVRVVPVADAGHLIPTDQPAAFASIVADALRTPPPAP